MLTRAAAGRRHGRHTSLRLSQLADSLYLPFLCPAQLRWTAAHSHRPSQARLHTRAQSTSHNLTDRSQTRRLATHAEAHAATSTTSPWTEQVPISSTSKDPFENVLYRASPADFIKFDHISKGPEDKTKMRHGIGGSTADLIQNLYTCLRVKRFERARLIIHRIAEQCPPGANEILHAHKAYLEHRLESLPKNTEGRQQIYEELQEWYESEIVEKRVDADADLYAYMVRSALVCLENPKRERAVRRFANDAQMKGQDHWDGVYNSLVLSDKEALALEAIFPDLVAEEVEESEQATIENGQHADPANLTLESPTGLPSILGVDQKGYGLSSLQAALASAVDNRALRSEAADDLSNVTLTPRERQEIIEKCSGEAAIQRWQREEEHLKDIGIVATLSPDRPIGALMWQWYQALLPALKEELAECSLAIARAETNPKLTDDRSLYGAHLESVPPEQVAATTIIYVMQLIAGGKNRDTESYSSDCKLSRLTASLGKYLQKEAEAQAKKNRMAASRKRQRSLRLKPRNSSSSESTETASAHISQPSVTPDIEEATANLVWPSDIRVKLGAMLVSKLIATAKISVTRTHPRTKEKVTQMHPAFLHKTTYEQGRKQGFLSPSPDLVEKLGTTPVQGLLAKRLPMVTQPEDWTGFSKGGYLVYSDPVIRFSSDDNIPRDYAHAAIAKGDLSKIFDALNVLGKIPWKINDDVLRVQVEAWNSGEAIANFAPLRPEREVVDRPLDETNINAMRKYKEAVKEVENRVSGQHSQRCFQNFQLEIARSFRKEIMYFPHNLDFRGRAYPIPPYLNHMGADNARALMKFAEGKELGVEGLRWLKIHLANVYGYDKASLQEREDFVMEHLSDIYDSATNPLTGRRWWLESEDAWQTLAACYELKHALDSPDPTKFVSTLPIHQDGTCNGLQHYAALGGDEAGARQVNLEPGDRPSDVYTAVADAVKAEVKLDFDNGHPVAKILHGRITRKVVKQPVMTNVYGVTYYGAREQVKKQVEELFPEIRRNDPVDHLTLASYIAKKIFKSLGEMFTGAQAIQQWLGECADRISTCVTPEQIEELRQESLGNVPFSAKKKPGKKAKSIQSESASRLSSSRTLFRSSVIWTTPLRLPVVQPYRSTKRRVVSTSLQSMSLQEPTSVDPVSKRKQLQGFPPNFIHSLDATHMMLSATACAEKGITFASIHDSFWTHASTITSMNGILRDAFVAMHSEDVVGRLREEFKARYKGAMYLCSVDMRSEVGRKIIEFQRSKTVMGRLGSKSAAKQPWQVKELLLEAERVRLLSSEDADERRQGEEMVTSGSIFADVADAEASIALPHEIMDAKLGEIPDVDAAAATDSTATEVADPAAEADDADVEDVREAKDHQQCDEDIIAEMKEKKEQKPRAQVRKVYVWLPLTFPKVPEKGTFDVRRLKQSQYFFH